jgi:phospholipid/cholesterol/gamma-HCH transport system permease protein
VSEALWTELAPGTGPTPPGRVRRVLAVIGRTARRQSAFLLLLASLGWGVLVDAVRPGMWRRTVRREFFRILRQALAGGLVTVLVSAALIGVLMVYQAIYWLGIAGQEDLIGTVVVTVLVREVAPVLVGLMLLGRSGTVAISEIGRLGIGGQLRTLEAQGIDTFQVLILPRACALALAAFSLGIFFIIVALLTGFFAGSLLGAVSTSLWFFLDRVLLAMRAVDFAIVPLKLLLTGLLAALTVSLTALGAGPRDDIATLLPLGFMRGLVAILLTSLALSLAA